MLYPVRIVVERGKSYRKHMLRGEDVVNRFLVIR